MGMHGSLLNGPADDSVEVVASDLEGTLTTGVFWEAMRDYLIEQGHEEAYKRFFLRKLPRYGLFKLGLISKQVMRDNWIIDLVGLFTGFSSEQMDEMGRYVVEKGIWPGRRQVLVDELLAHRAAGRRVLIVTGQFEPILGHLLPMMDGIEGIGTPLRFEDGVFTGEIDGPLTVGNRKAEKLGAFMRNGRIFAAYGDTEADIPMLRVSENPVAVYPDNQLRVEAVRQGWRVLEEEQV